MSADDPTTSGSTIHECQWSPNLSGRQEREAVRAEPVVRDVPEIEEPGEPTATLRPRASSAKTSVTVPTRRK